MTRSAALASASDYFHSRKFLADLTSRVAVRTESADPSAPGLQKYLTDEIAPALAGIGFTCDMPEPAPGARNRFLIASRIEDEKLPTILIYGHGDVVPGMDGQWAEELSPWRVTAKGDRLYGRGTADNKGQHIINLAALAHVFRTRGGRLGFNAKLLFEMGEEIGSPELRVFCNARRSDLAADLLIASDGPRLSQDRPTLFLGARGILQIRLSVALRAGGHHSGNWGGLLANPAVILAAAIASLIDARGRILVDALRPPPIPANVRRALADVEITPGPSEPAIDAGWGEPGLTPAEQLYGWNSLDVLGISAGDPAHPAGVTRPLNAIPGRADAVLQLRFVVGTDLTNAEAALRAHLDAHGFGAVAASAELLTQATRLDADDPWVHWAAASVKTTTGKTPVILPNFGGSLPNDIFVEELGLKTIWVPHSYPGCNQHAPDEHLLGSVAEEGLAMMTGLFWDLGEGGATPPRPLPPA